MIKRALISVYDKTGIEEFARSLRELGIELISTGGTAKLLRDNNIEITQISEVTGFEECLDGRVKTLHPNIHGGILAIRDNKGHMEQLNSMEIEPIDIVVSNLYPFRDTLLSSASHEEIVENIDIGGPAMLRSAAKNYNDVVIIVDPQDYQTVIEDIKNKGQVAPEAKLALAAKAFRHVAHYDSLIAQYFTRLEDNRHPEVLSLSYVKQQNLRYGENPQQTAAFYKEDIQKGISLSKAVQLHGKELSFNNILDTSAALEIVMEFDKPAAVAVKHGNPCGAALGKDIYDAYIKAYNCDTQSIFGGIIALNREVDLATAKEINSIFVEVLIAPSYSKEALEVLTSKKNIRLLELKEILEQKPFVYNDIKRVRGGVLVQTSDNGTEDNEKWNTVTLSKITANQREDLEFAWKICKYVKSNAIVVAKDEAAIGIGPGQVCRIWSVEKALTQAGDKAKGAVLASDGFFPFEDSLEMAARYGIKAVIQPGGSVADGQSIAVANREGMGMVFTGERHFRH